MLVRLLASFPALLVSLVLIPSLAFAQEVNLIQNPSLETAVGGAPTNWTKTFWGSPSPTFQYPVLGRTGNGASVSFSKNSSGDARWQHSPVTVDAGKAYTYSSWYKSTATTELNAAYTTASGQTNYAWLATLPATNNVWQQANISITIPSNATKASIFHLIDKTGSLTVDDFSLVLTGATSTPPPPPNPTPTTTPPTTDPTAFSEGMVSITFDDSWLSQYENAMPILEAAGLKGTFYITTEPIQNNWDGFINLAQLKNIALKGHELGGHTVTHADLSTLRSQRISAEIRNSKTYIQSQTGAVVTSLAYPYGSFNNTVITQTKQAGYTNARGVEEGLVKKTDDTFTLKSHSVGPSTSLASIRSYIDQAKANKQWYILTLHEIDTLGGEYSTTPQDLQAIVDYIKSTGIKSVTVQQGVAAMMQ